MVTGKQVRLFLTDGMPGGLLTAEIMNWTGQIVAGSRSDLAMLLARPEAGKTGVYFLTGVNEEDPDDQMLYIGEGDDVSIRLKMHNRGELEGGKDFWTRALLLTSKDANLTKAHVRYLESRFIQLGKSTDRTTIVNKTAPPLLPLPEADISDMEYFISQARIVLPLLGVEAFREVPRNENEATDPDRPKASSPVFELNVPAGGEKARGQEVDGEFVVYEGSAVRRQWVGTHTGYRKLYDRLSVDGTFEDEGQVRRFTKPYAFKSPSAAAAVVTGRPTNGRTSWIAPETGMSYAQWQEQSIPMTQP
ncbi:MULTISPECIES: GIY-YIG nuclease family protein [unclassified Arthrobacter]|uniref:GIY-YIG nuclease family protein n=1 Tax=unclassified Arthrobacter TaxID=235627 RepID=UPI0014917770|nr:MULTISPECIES: GIY-YIG nuclease family protein [unclassified Arthrobacter]MBE0009797.1 GIY-YIG nuclease family protein [Arthrobacter sp. AET 35A]NOJ63703.1 GIY-YIG nuclease family protein [Arthrobacter sp. 147(2020)]